jgi:hypothetical protein
MPAMPRRNLSVMCSKDAAPLHVGQWKAEKLAENLIMSDYLQLQLLYGSG